MSDTFARRREKLIEILRDAGLDGVAFVPGANFTYLTGLNFHLMERPTILFITATGDISAIMPELERLKWSASFGQTKTHYWQDKDGYQAAFAAAARDLAGMTIGVEGQRMRVFEVDSLRQHLTADHVVDMEQSLTGLRIAKEPDEIALLQEAIRISEIALEETVSTVRAGQTEQEILNTLNMRMLAGGAHGFAFGAIVLAGGKSANPHGSSDGSRLAPGDPLLIDFGAMVGGYNADITRTFFCDHVRDDHAAIYETVLAANTRGRKIAGPSLSAHDLDEAVTGVLAASPFSDLIAHKTGHGLGLDVHEAPQIMVGNMASLVPGALFTIEPGLYRENDIGVRIEDDVLITAAGARSLTNFDRSLRVLKG